MTPPSPRPRPRPNTVTEKSPAERLTGVADRPTPRKRGRDRIVEFLGRKWDREATHPQIGWTLAHECLATPEMLQRLRAQFELEDAAGGAE